MRKVSVIVPNYNHGIYLRDRLRSIFNQTYQDFEVILMDDASTDDSQSVLKQFAKNEKVSHYIINDKNSGSTFKQWNKGIQLAKGDYIWIAESDDVCSETFLEELLRPLELDAEIELSYCQSHKMNSAGEITGNWITQTNNFKSNCFEKNFVMDGFQFIEKFLIHKNVIPNVSAVVFRKRSLDKIMPLSINNNMKYYADWFYYIQILCITGNSKIAFLAKSLNFFRYHDHSVIAKAGNDSGWLKIFKMELEGRKEMMDYIDNCNPKNLSIIKKQWKKGNEKLKLHIANHYLVNGRPFQSLTYIWDQPEILKNFIIGMLKRKFNR